MTAVLVKTAVFLGERLNRADSTSGFAGQLSGLLMSCSILLLLLYHDTKSDVASTDEERDTG